MEKENTMTTNTTKRTNESYGITTYRLSGTVNNRQMNEVEILCNRFGIRHAEFVKYAVINYIQFLTEKLNENPNYLI